MSKCVPALLLFGLGLVLPFTSSAHEELGPEVKEPRAYLDVWVDNSGFTYISVHSNLRNPEWLMGPLRRAVDCHLEDVNVWTSDGETYLNASCGDGFVRKDLLVGGEVALGPLKEALLDLGVTRLEVGLGHSLAAHTRGSEVLGEFDADWGYGYYFFKEVTKDAPDSVEMSFGFPRETVRQVAAIIALLIGLPVLAVVWMARRSIRMAEQGADVWLSFIGALQGFILLVWAVWWGLVSYYHLDHLPAFLLQVNVYGEPFYDFIRNGVWAVAPVITAILCSAAAHPVTRRVGGQEYTLRETVLQITSMLLAIVIPALLIFTALNSLGAQQYRTAVLVFFSAVVALGLLGVWARKYQAMTPVPLTTGELRDRVFELAEKAGVKLRQLYLLPGGKARLANAFAIGTRQMMISELLIEKLSRREVDAVLGHELAHLKSRHSWLLIPAVVGSLAVAGFLMVVFVSWVPGWAYGALLIVSTIAVLGIVSRRFERSADTGAVEITDDPEAFISGQAKITAINMLPMDWSKGLGFLLTHPSARQRIDATAKRAGIPAERVEEILNAPEVDGEHYEIPRPATEGERAFSTKAMMLGGLGKLATGLFGVVGPVLLAVQAVHWFSLPPAGAVAAYALAFAVALSAILLFEKWEPMMGLASMARRVREKVTREGFPAEELDGLVVGFGPSDGPRVYESAHFWDIGCLFLTSDRFSYVGEQTRFSLRRDQIEKIEGRHNTPLLWPERVPVVYWNDREAERSGVFCLGRVEPPRFSELFAEEAVLERRVHAWQRENVAMSTPQSLADLNSPDIASVTSQSIRESMSVSAILGVSLVTAFFAGVVGVLFDLPFGHAFGLEGAGWQLVIVATAARTVLSLGERWKLGDEA